jgi:hypothetical protein
MKCYVVCYKNRRMKKSVQKLRKSCYYEIGKICSTPSLVRLVYQLPLKKERDIEWSHVVQSIVHKYATVLH